MTYEFVLPGAVWAVEDGELVLDLGAVAAHVVLLVALHAAAVAVAHVHHAVGAAAGLVLVGLEVPDAATALGLVLATVLLQHLEVLLSLLTGGLPQGALGVEGLAGEGALVDRTW